MTLPPTRLTAHTQRDSAFAGKLWFPYFNEADRRWYVFNRQNLTAYHHRKTYREARKTLSFKDRLPAVRLANYLNEFQHIPPEIPDELISPPERTAVVLAFPRK